MIHLAEGTGPVDLVVVRSEVMFHLRQACVVCLGLKIWDEKRNELVVAVMIVAQK